MRLILGIYSVIILALIVLGIGIGEQILGSPGIVMGGLIGAKLGYAFMIKQGIISPEPHTKENKGMRIASNLVFGLVILLLLWAAWYVQTE